MAATANVTAVRQSLRQVVNPEKAAFFPRFFKAGPGEYGEGDKFLGVTVPDIRVVVKQYADLPLGDVEQLLTSQWHEERQAAVLILVAQYAKAHKTRKSNKAADAATEQQIYEFYLSHSRWINNWDLVDCSAEHIVGPWLDGRPEKLEVLENLARSALVWDRRIAMLATFHYIKQGRADEALVVADMLLHDPHDLIQKAVGWMLREIGKRADQSLLVAFLDRHAAAMPRTTLRYAIEHFTPERRQQYLALKQAQK